MLQNKNNLTNREESKNGSKKERRRRYAWGIFITLKMSTKNVRKFDGTAGI